LFGEESAADAFTAISTAIEKMEKQILKLREKWRDTKRGPKEEPEAEAAPAAKGGAKPKAEPEPETEAESGPQVFRADRHQRRKPMTLEEAMLEIDGRDYVVYRDTENDRVRVLIRRRDGNFDLIEA